MLKTILVFFGAYFMAHGQGDDLPPALPETVFGDTTFLPEIVPLSVKRSYNESGQQTVTIDIVYSQDFGITWAFHGSSKSYIDGVYSRVTETVPSTYTLQITTPTETNEKRNVSANSYFEGKTEQLSNDYFTMEDDDILVDKQELYIHFQAQNPPEAVTLKLFLDDIHDENNDEHVNKSPFLEEAVPKFPEMQELGVDSVIITEGTRTQVPIRVLFTDQDRYSVRGLVYNSSSQRIFTTVWSTTYQLGPSDFYKIPSGYDDGSDHFNDGVKLENMDFDESSKIKIVSINIPTENNDISAVYTLRAHHESPVTEPSFVFVSTLEQTFIAQRGNQTHGPIPPGVLEFEHGAYSRVTCRIGHACLITCHVFGVGVQSLKLMHKDTYGEFVDVPGEVLDYGTFESQGFAFVDSTDPGQSGTYICSVISGHVSLNKEIDVSFVNK